MTTKLMQNGRLNDSLSNCGCALSASEIELVAGGRIKLNDFRGTLLTNACGDPVAVYVDGVLINSVTDGYVHL